MFLFNWKKTILLFQIIFMTFTIFGQQFENSQSNLEIFSHKKGKTRSLEVKFGEDAQPTTITVEVIDGYVIFEGDIILGTEEDVFANQAAIQNIENKQWPNSTIPFTIQAGYPDSSMIYYAINRVISTTNICMIPRTTETNYVEFVISGGCGSSIGMQPTKQFIGVNPACGIGSTIHEILHAAGHFHEQTRQDRDDYITINFSNIVSGKEGNFQKYNTGIDVGPYDYKSIMHYGANGFAIDNNIPTIEINRPPGKSYTTIGQRRVLSDGDIVAINQAYPATTGCSIFPMKPNLSIRSLGTMTIDGTIVTVQGRQIENNGTSASQPTEVWYYHYKENTNSKIRFLTVNIPSLAPGELYSVDFSANLATLNLSDGNYIIGMRINPRSDSWEGYTHWTDNRYEPTLPKLILPIPKNVCPADSLALITLYNVTDGINWTNSWNLSQPVSSWYGVTINASGCVTSIALANNNLIGTLPSELNSFSNLRSIYLNDNHLYGCYSQALRAYLCDIDYNFINNPGLPNNGDFQIFCYDATQGCPTETDDVWPGDLNNDGEVSIVDVLYHMNRIEKIGPIRPNASSEWNAQPSPDWSDILGGVNNKHQDGNGDGFINNEDLNIVFENYNKERPAPPSNLPADFTFRFEPVTGSDPDRVEYDMYLETVNTPDDIIGIAASVRYGEFIENGGGRGISFAGSPLGGKLIKSNGAKNAIDFASIDIRRDLFSEPIARIFVLKNSINATNFQFNVRASRIIIVESIGSDLDTSFVNIGDFTIYDNYNNDFPNATSLIANVTHATCATLGNINILLSDGSSLSDASIQWNNGSQSAQINHLEAGTYSVVITTLDGTSITANYEIKGGLNCTNAVACVNDLDLNTFEPENQTYYVKQQLRASCNIPVSNNIVYHAGESIILEPGFHVEAGAQFTAKIEDCSINNSLTTPNTISRSVLTAPDLNLPNDLGLNVFPNPMNDAAIVAFDLPEASKVSIYIMDIQGKPIQKLLNHTYQEKGKHQLEWNRNNIPKGMYFIRLQTESETRTTKVFVLD